MEACICQKKIVILRRFLCVRVDTRESAQANNNEELN
jgi:hypothetical protein